jgi:hypothetical protein
MYAKCFFGNKVFHRPEDSGQVGEKGVVGSKANLSG